MSEEVVWGWAVENHRIVRLVISMFVSEQRAVTIYSTTYRQYVYLSLCL